jgi:hypothetical protein
MSDKQRHRRAQQRRQTYSVEEAGRILGVGRNLAYEAAARGQIPTIRMANCCASPVLLSTECSVARSRLRRSCEDYGLQ